MTNEIEQLARRAVACPGWRWVGRMVDTEGRTVLIVGEDGQPVVWAQGLITSDGTGWQWGAYRSSLPRPCIPDLTDPATLGCLLALVREAWGRPDASVVQRTGTGGDSYWILALPSPPRPFPPPTGDTEAEALVAALEAAPVRNTQAREEKSCPA